MITARLFRISEYGPNLRDSLPWSLVGTFRVHELTQTKKVIKENQIYGKCIKRGDTIMTVPRNILREK